MERNIKHCRFQLDSGAVRAEGAVELNLTLNRKGLKLAQVRSFADEAHLCIGWRIILIISRCTVQT